MLIESLSHLASLDLGWFVSLILGNLHWVFALFAFTFIAEKGHRPVWHFLLLVGLLYAFGDVLGLTGWLLAPFFLIVTFQLLIGCFFPEGTWPRRHFALVVQAFILSTCFIYTFYFNWFNLIS